MEQTQKRFLKGHQPARALLLDITQAIDIKIWQRVIGALNGFLSIVCNMSGPARIPLLSIYLLDAYPEIMLPFCQLKGNLCRILTATRDIKMHIEERLLVRITRPAACFVQGLCEVCGQYRRHLNAVGQLQGGGNHLPVDQLEIVIMSGDSQEALCKQLDKSCTDLDMHLIRRLVAVILTTGMDDEFELPKSGSTSSRDTDDNGLMDFMNIETDDDSLQKFFYSWLLDTSTDIEHLQLRLPPPSPVDQPVTIKCDFIERIINPAQLPHHEFFNLHPDSVYCKLVFPCPSKTAGLTVPVYNLNILAALPADSVCDSLVFGLPLQMQATTCWRLDWEELEMNAANYHALCQELIAKKQVLLAQLQDTLHSTASSFSNRPQVSPRASNPQGFFILLVAPNHTLLVKAVASRELVLPSVASFLTGSDATDESLLRIKSSLTQVPVLDVFNPLSYSTGIVNVLLQQAAPKQFAVKPRPACKRKSKSTINEKQGIEHNDSNWMEPSATPSVLSVYPGKDLFSLPHMQREGYQELDEYNTGHTESSAWGGHEGLGKITRRHFKSPARGGHEGLGKRGEGYFTPATNSRAPDGFLFDLE